jgi:hypothetical protein
VELLAVPRDDEQRVVDADAQSDHQPDERSELRHLEDVAEQDHESAADPDAEQGDRDREAHGQHRSEGHDQDDDGEGEAEQLGRRLLELGEDEAAQLDPQAVDRRCRVDDRVAHVLRIRERHVLRELDVGVGDLAFEAGLLRDEALAARLVRRLHPGDALHLGHVGQQRLHGRPHLGVGHALVGREDDRAHLPRALTSELGIQDVEPFGRLRAREAEVLAVVRSDPACDAVAHDENGDPQREHEATPVMAPGTEAGEHGSSSGGASGEAQDAVRSTDVACPPDSSAAGMFRGVNRESLTGD